MSKSTHDDFIINGDDELIFAEEEEEVVEDYLSEEKWKLLIVDDEEEVHRVTKMVLEDFTFDNKKFQFLSAFSGKEAKKVIQEHPDVSLILLDVVMETNHSGLEVVQFIREELNNNFVRIILRTGQPGHAPEREVITKYDINDYKLKSMLTDQSLFTTVTTAIRTYRDVNIIEKNRQGLEHILTASRSLFRLQSLKQFAYGALTQLTSILGLNDSSLYVHTSGFTALQENGDLMIIASTGKYKKYINKPLKQVISDQILDLIKHASKIQDSIITDEYYIGYCKTQNGSENFLYVGGFKQNLSELDKNIIRIFTSNLSIALDNILLNKEVVDTQKEVVITLGEVVETRSKETANHVRRVAEYSHLLAKLAGLNDEQAELLRLSSPMHDVGKIGIPDTILNKPGRLTPQEFEVIKTHTHIGYDILKHSDRQIMKAAAIIALQHHERWNGKGYPNNLQGESIHIFGRITGLVDVFDALSYKRVYKDAWPIDRILELVQSERGEHFDPYLVDLFLSHLNQFIDIKLKYPDEEK